MMARKSTDSGEAAPWPSVGGADDPKPRLRENTGTAGLCCLRGVVDAGDVAMREGGGVGRAPFVVAADDDDGGDDDDMLAAIAALAVEEEEGSVLLAMHERPRGG